MLGHSMSEAEVAVGRRLMEWKFVTEIFLHGNHVQDMGLLRAILVSPSNVMTPPQCK